MIDTNSNNIQTSRRYKHPKITLCTTCKGTGVHSFLDDLEKEHSEVCPDCEGSGRVVVSGVIEFTVQPYKPGTFVHRDIARKV
jgi:DnaJ-class molecular chaperone